MEHLDRPRAVILLSGGIDSATCLAIARAEGYQCHALSFDYGQRHRYELKAADCVARSLGVAQHIVVPIDLRAFGGSALTDDKLSVPKRDSLACSASTRPGAGDADSIPITYVPARNTIFLSLALAYAEVIAAQHIFIGANAVDFSGYPDCRPEFIAAFQHMANLATRAAVEGRPVTIHTPIIELTKAQIILRGAELGVDYGLTHSCYDPVPDVGLACGRCDSCLLRQKGFEEAGVADPTRYVTGDAE